MEIIYHFSDGSVSKSNFEFNSVALNPYINIQPEAVNKIEFKSYNFNTKANNNNYTFELNEKKFPIKVLNNGNFFEENTYN